MAIQDFMPRVGYGLDRVPTGAKNADDLLALLPNPDATSIFYSPYDVDGSIAKAAFERGWPVDRIFVNCPADCRRTVRSNVRRFKGCETQVFSWSENFVFSIKSLRATMDKIFEHLRDPKFVIGFNPDWRFYKKFIEAYLPKADYMAWISPDGWLTREGDADFRQQLMPGVTEIIHNSRSADRFKDIYTHDGCTIVSWSHSRSSAKAKYRFDDREPMDRDLNRELEERGLILQDLGTTLQILSKIEAKIGLAPLPMFVHATNLFAEEAKLLAVPEGHPQAMPFFTHGWVGFIDRSKFSCKYKDLLRSYNVVFAEFVRKPRKDGKSKLLDRMEILSPGCGWSATVANIPVASLAEARSIRSINRRTLTRWLGSLSFAGRRVSPSFFSRYPMVERTRLWDDDQELYDLCGLTESDIAIIEAKILPWPASDSQNA
jgi:hypothetical protein